MQGNVFSSSSQVIPLSVILTHSCVSLVNHLSHIQQVDLEEECQSTACDLVWSPTDGITQFAPYRQTNTQVLRLEHKERGGQRRYVMKLVCALDCKCCSYSQRSYKFKLRYVM